MIVWAGEKAQWRRARTDYSCSGPEFSSVLMAGDLPLPVTLAPGDPIAPSGLYRALNSGVHTHKHTFARNLKQQKFFL